MFRHQSRAGRVVSQLLVVVLLVVLTLPLLLVVKESLEGEGWRNYVEVVAGTPFLRFFLNSIVIAATTVVVVTTVAMAAAYGMVVLRATFARTSQIAIIAGLALPGMALTVPLFVTIQRLGLFDTPIAVILPLSALTVPFGVLVARNYLMGIPDEIHEAARLDGAGAVQIFARIVVPLARPIMAVIIIFTFLAAWNEYFLPLLFLQDHSAQVVTQIPTYFQSERHIDLPKVFAANLLISLPIVALYLVFQRQVRAGFLAGAIK
ncbi:carbohydrate ABC transporter permease [Jiangella asiatica]|uniref:Carbohydrate ABC transporter permease n=1 Tax=Jiangella asiatica TaxID=2530372 RepID=A0A4R5D8J3_9ACTN|nr:carbohydrate ABC transporter permease [Jiangella asiatica]TDE09882.1 carbohydrate ABC transporter permease [Jiangella asiatica]